MNKKNWERELDGIWILNYIITQYKQFSETALIDSYNLKVGWVKIL